MLLVKPEDLGEFLTDFTLPLSVGGAALFDIAEIDKVVEFGFIALQLIAAFHYHELHLRRAADGLLHLQLAAFHAAGQTHFAIAGQDRDGAHFAQIHAYRIVGVNRLLNLLRGREFLAVLNFLGVEKIGILVKRDPEGFVTVR